MMTFEEFSMYAKDHVTDLWEDKDQYEVNLCQVTKNNGHKVTNLQIRKKGEAIAPLIILRDYYVRYQARIPLDLVLEMICRNYFSGMESIEECLKMQPDWEIVKNKIIFRLVNFRKNKKMLKSAPHVPFADLAVTFRWLAGTYEDKVGTILIDNTLFQSFKMSEEELLTCAMENTKRLFPPKICTMEEMLLKLSGHDCRNETVFSEDLSKVYVLTNEFGVNGASAVLYDHVLEEFSDTIDGDFYVIPSSIHEVLLVPMDTDMEPETIRRIIHEVNTVAVNPDDYLSDSLYCYEREKGYLCLAD